jgi:hypothetical protein
LFEPLMVELYHNKPLTVLFAFVLTSSKIVFPSTYLT